MPFTPTVYTYGADKQPVEYTGEYLSGPMDQHICGYCDSHGFGDSLSAAIETPVTPSLATAAPVLSAPVVEPVVPETPIDKSEEVFKSSPKAAEQGINAEDGSSLFEGVANLGLLKSQAMAALKGKYDITDEHLEQAKHQTDAQGKYAAYEYGQKGYVHPQGFTNVFPGYTSGQLYGQMNYGRDSTGKDAYSHFGAGTAYTYAPGYGKTYGLVQAAPQHHPTSYGRLLANAYNQPAPQVYQQPQHY